MRRVYALYGVMVRRRQICIVVRAWVSRVHRHFEYVVNLRKAKTEERESRSGNYILRSLQDWCGLLRSVSCSQDVCQLHAVHTCCRRAVSLLGEEAQVEQSHWNCPDSLRSVFLEKCALPPGAALRKPHCSHDAPEEKCCQIP